LERHGRHERRPGVTDGERAEMARLHRDGLTLRGIGERVGRMPETVRRHLIDMDVYSPRPAARRVAAGHRWKMD